MIKYLENQSNDEIKENLIVLREDRDKLEETYKMVKKQNHIREFRNYLKIKSLRDKEISSDLRTIRLEKLNINFRNNRVLTKHFRCQMMQ